MLGIWSLRSTDSPKKMAGPKNGPIWTTKKSRKQSVKTDQKIHLFIWAKWNHITLNLRFSPKIGRGISPQKPRQRVREIGGKVPISVSLDQIQNRGSEQNGPIQGGPLAVINGVITPRNGLINGELFL